MAKATEEGKSTRLPGLWACTNPDCSEIVDPSHRSQVCGRLYSQPRQRCGCGSQVLELFTCRNCGAAYGRAYADNVEEPQALWNEPGKQLRMESGDVSAMNPLDLLLEEPRQLEASPNLACRYTAEALVGRRQRRVATWRDADACTVS